ncbi:MAG: choice-of-anchor Q domain-containing protein, partial [Candidatus Sericytochromatia bacterium]
SASTIISNMIISNNYSSTVGAGIYNNANSSPTISNIIFHNNTASSWGGGIANYGSPSIISNVVFYNNSASLGGAIFNFYSSPTISNITVYNNTSSSGAVVFDNNSSSTIKNSIIWGNSNNLSGQSSLVMTYSNIQGGYAGTGNINSDPLFVNVSDPDGADNIWGTSDDGLRLSASSPSRNTGTNTGAPSTDITALARPKGILTDMGAYEYNE